ncbi:serine hydrolase domain-containing protein [Hellea balneolensis]|uniref:serine hydrolase domain-containing protein n=1 Tax=Hellea balneolensis TaxID=287478 RepID=UPI00042991DA|nr:serine hydrolase [Hellea balneolensis]
MGKRRIIGAVALGAILFGGAFMALNWENIQRLKTVNTLFDEDKIVNNFSNMDAAFLHQDLAASPNPFIFPKDAQALPKTVFVNGQERDLEKLLADLDTTALIVLKDGNIVHESYSKGTAQDDLRISWSVAKSFMSGLYGNAVKSGAIKSLDDKVEDYAPALKGSAYEGATIRNVLNMASGITFDEDYMDPKSDINDMGRILGLGGSMDDYAAGLTDKDVPAGTRWQYVSIDTHIAAMVLRAASGNSLHELFNETYSAHLGFERAPVYMTDGENVAFALGGLNLTTRDYAKFGQMFLQNGEFGGTQVVPAEWVAASTVHSAPTMSDRDVGYGYQWWIPMPQEGPNKGDYTAAGIYGQYIYVNPARGIVIAKNAADREFAYPQDGYGHSMNVNMDMFRSIADYYGEE